MITNWIRKQLNLLMGNDHSRLHKKLIRAGHLVTGTDTRIEKCKVYMPAQPQPGFANITIGKDSMIEGNFVLYSPTARVTIGDRVYMGPGTTIYCYEEIEIGDDIMFSWDITLLDTNAHSLEWKDRQHDVVNWKKGAAFKDWSVVQHEKVVVKSKAWIGFNSIVLKGVTIGEGAVVAAGSVVVKSVDDFTVVGGNPAQFIKKTS